MIRPVSRSRQWSVAILSLLWFSAAPACAVVVSATNFDATSAAPAAAESAWSNVVYRGQASAVYLGNRWVLTANHVGDGSIRLSDGRQFGMTAGSGVQLNNTGTGVAGTPDLRMFRLVDDPGLPSLEIDTVRPPAGSSVLMIGNGYDRASPLEGWRVTGSGLATNWTPVSPLFANVLGYNLLSSATKRWGNNEVSSGPLTINGATAGFATRFDRFALPFEAQAVTGDSGGGVFRVVDGSLKLVGMMDAIQTLTNQPGGTSVFGDQSMIADLSTYRGQIMDLVTRRPGLAESTKLLRREWFGFGDSVGLSGDFQRVESRCAARSGRQPGHGSAVLRCQRRQLRQPTGRAADHQCLDRRHRQSVVGICCGSQCRACTGARHRRDAAMGRAVGSRVELPEHRAASVRK